MQYNVADEVKTASANNKAGERTRVTIDHNLKTARSATNYPNSIKRMDSIIKLLMLQNHALIKL